MLYLSFCELILLSITSSKFIDLVAGIRNSFLLKAAYYSILCMYDILFIHLSISVYIWVVSAFWLRCIMVLLWTQVYKYLLEIQHSVLLSVYPEAKFLDLRIIVIFPFLRNYHTVFPSGCPFYIPTGNVRVLISSHPLQHYWVGQKVSSSFS